MRAVSVISVKLAPRRYCGHVLRAGLWYCMHPVTKIKIDKIAILYNFIRIRYSITKETLLVFVEKQFGVVPAADSTLFIITRVTS